MNRPTIGMMEITGQDAWTLLLCSIRYAMGRQTYMPSLVCSLVRKYAQVLTSEQLRQVQHEIREEAMRAHAHGQHIGADFDENGWLQLVNWIEAILDGEP